MLLELLKRHLIYYDLELIQQMEKLLALRVATSLIQEVPHRIGFLFASNLKNSMFYK